MTVIEVGFAAEPPVLPPLPPGGGIPGGFFHFPQVGDPWRWDPLAGRNADGSAVARWVPWHLPEAPKQEKPFLERIGLVRRAADTGEKNGRAGDQREEEDGEGDTAAKAAADMYQAAVDRHRDAVKWLVVTAGAVATAVVGTAPLSGLADAIPGPGGTIAAIGFLVLVVALVAILITVTWVSRPVGTNTTELGRPAAERGGWQERKWLERIQDRYRSDPAVFLDAKARDLTEYRDYRAAWLGVAADIDRALLEEPDFDRSQKLGKYRGLAQAQLRADHDSTAVNIKRGMLEIMRRRAEVASMLVVVFALVAVGAFILYLYGIGKAQRPSVEKIQASPSEPSLGDDVRVSLVATGDDLSYTWTLNDVPLTRDDDGYYGVEGPILRIFQFDAGDAGTYGVTVTDQEGQSDSDSVELAAPT